MNAKLGGVPWSISKLPFCDKPTMVVGLSMFSKRGSKNIMGMCASVNSTCNRFFSRVKEQKGEISDQLQSMFSDAFENFKTANNIYPQRIVVYREGVGEGQKKVLLEQEIPQINAAIDAIEGMKDKSKITYVLVNTRVKTKFVKAEGRLQNPMPGTVLDHSVVKKDSHEFYLVSASCRQGVPSPAHYSVLVDDIKIGAEAI